MTTDILIFHVPKFNNWYRPLDQFNFILYHPMGLLGLADFAGQNGISANIVDLGVENRKYGKMDLAAILDQYRPSLVGLSLHWHFQSYDVIETAREIKKIAADIPIVLGGFTASYFREEILSSFPFIDFVIKGDAEIPLVELFRCVNGNSDLSGVPNLAHRRDGQVVTNEQSYLADEATLNRINFTRFEFIKDYPDYIDSLTTWFNLRKVSRRMHHFLFGGEKKYPVFIGRGCIHECSYCGGSATSQKIINNRSSTIRRSAEAVAHSVREVERYGFDAVTFPWDPMPRNVADAYYCEVFRLLQDPPVNLALEVERYSLPSREFLAEFRKTFNRNSYITISLYHSNEEFRKRNKLYFYSNKELEDELDLMEEMGVKAMLFFSSGLPGEDSSLLKEQLEYQKRIRRKYDLVSVKTWFVEIEPCSNLSRNPQEYGITLQRKNFLDYYTYHSQPDRNHFQEIGYLNSGEKTDKHLKRYFCTHFCWVFKAGVFSPLFCRLIGFAWKLGLIPLYDKITGALGSPAKKPARNPL